MTDWNKTGRKKWRQVTCFVQFPASFFCSSYLGHVFHLLGLIAASISVWVARG